MFGEKAARIKELEDQRDKLMNENRGLTREVCHYESKARRLEEENAKLKDELEKIKPVFETPGFKPAVSILCEYCRFAYFSDYDDTLLGCCKDVVCENFEAANRPEE